MKSNAFSKDIIRTIKKERKRFLAILIITVLGVTMFSGLQAACKDLRYSADAFFDRQNLHDFVIQSTLGLTDDDIAALEELPGVEYAEGVYAETVTASVGEKSVSVSMEVLSVSEMDRPYLVEGHMPRKADEVVVTDKFLRDSGAQVGDRMVIEEDLDPGDEDHDPEKPTFENTCFTITGVVVDVRNINNPRGATSFRTSSTRDETVFVLDRAAEYEIYTSVQLVMEGGKELFCYGPEYEAKSAALKETIEKELKAKREKARYDQVVGEAYEELDKAEKEVYAELSDAEKELKDGEETLKEELAEAEKKLSDAETELADGRKELADGWKEYESGKQEAQNQFSSARWELESGKKQLEDSKKTLAEKQQELNEGKAQLEQGLAQAQDGLVQIDDGISQIEDGLSEIDGYLPQIEDGLSQIEEGMRQLNMAIWLMEQSIQAMERLNEAGVYPSDRYEADRAYLEDQYQQLQAQKEEVLVQKEELLTQQATLKTTREELLAQKTELEATREETEAAITMMTEKLAEVEAGQAQINAGAAELAAGEKELNQGEATLNQKEAETYQTLSAARKELEQGETELSDGEKELADGWKEYYDGKAEGEKELADGWKEYREGKQEAEEKFADAREEIDEIEMPTWYIWDRKAMDGYTNVGSDADAIESIGTVFPIIFFLVAIMISLTTVTRMVEEDRGLIGTYKALGFSNREIRRKYLIYSASASLAGGLIGTLAAFLLLPFIVILIFRIMYLIPDYVYVFVPSYGILGPILFLGGILLATLEACQHELKLTPASLMRPKTPKAGSRVILEWIPWVWNRMSFLNKVTARNLFRYKKRMVMTIFGIAGCMALLLFGFAIKDSVDDLLPRQYEQTFQYDLLTAVAFPKDNGTLCRQLQEAEEVEDYVNVQVSSVTLQYEDSAELAAQILVFPDADSMESYVTLRNLSGEIIPFEEDKIYVTRNAGLILEFAEGDRLHVQFPDLKEGEVRADVLVENYLSNYLYMTAATYEKTFGAWEANGALVHLSDEVEDPKKFAEEFKEKDKIVTSLAVQGFKDDFAKSFILILMVVYVVIIMSAALAFVVLFTLSTTNISERERELATIKVLGFYDPEVHSYVNKETYLLTGIGILLGMPLGYAFAQTLTVILKIPAIYLATSLHPISYVYATGLTLLFALIVNVITGFALNKINPAIALKSME